MLFQQSFKALGKPITHLRISHKPSFTGLRPPIELQIADAIVKHNHFKWAAMLPMTGTPSRSTRTCKALRLSLNCMKTKHQILMLIKP